MGGTNFGSLTRSRALASKLFSVLMHMHHAALWDLRAKGCFLLSMPSLSLGCSGKACGARREKLRMSLLSMESSALCGTNHRADLQPATTATAVTSPIRFSANTVCEVNVAVQCCNNLYTPWQSNVAHGGHQHLMCTSMIHSFWLCSRTACTRRRGRFVPSTM